MITVCSVSMGASSMAAAEKVLAANAVSKKPHQIIIWVANTNIEHPDSWRFLGECVNRWSHLYGNQQPATSNQQPATSNQQPATSNQFGRYVDTSSPDWYKQRSPRGTRGFKLIIHQNTHDPYSLHEDAKIIPNNLIARCTYVLKVLPFKLFLERLSGPVRVVLGLDWSERHRIYRRNHYTKKTRGQGYRRPSGWQYLLSHVSEYFPMAEPPYAMEPTWQMIERDWGIRAPQMYHDGYKHNNCGARCIKQGIKDWQRTRQLYPGVHLQAAVWERKQQYTLNTTRTILKQIVAGLATPLSLDTIPLLAVQKQQGFDSWDTEITLPDVNTEACLCNSGEWETPSDEDEAWDL